MEWSHGFFLIQFYVPFKIISTHMRRAGPISRWAKTGEPREKPPGTPASRTWLVSHVARAGRVMDLSLGLEPWSGVFEWIIGVEP